MKERDFFSKFNTSERKRSDPVSYWSAFSEEQKGELDFLAVKKRRKLLEAAQKRGFERLEEVRFGEVKIESMKKNKLRQGQIADIKIVRGDANVMTIKGTIELDSFLLTKEMEVFNWQANVILNDSVYALALNDKKPFAHIFIKVELKKQDELKNHLLQEFPTNNPSDFNNFTRNLLKEYGLLDKDEWPRFVSLRNITEQIDQRIKTIMVDNVNHRKLENWETLSTEFKVQTDISSKSEKEIAEMFKQALQTGNFDSMLLYLGQGADRFLEICSKEEYALTNSEIVLIKENIDKIVQELQGTEIYDLGPGNGKKLKEILKKIIDNKKRDKDDKKIIYHPIDINPTMIMATAQELSDLEEVEIDGVVCDFRKMVEKIGSEKNSFFILGNTLGNGNRKYQIQLLRDIGRGMKIGEDIFVGIQLRRDLSEIVKAYKTKEMEVLIKEQFKTRYKIDDEDVEYKVFADEEKGEIVMSLVFNNDKKVEYRGEEREFEAGESFKIVVSHKYVIEEVEDLFKEAGFVIKKKMDNQEKSYEIVMANLRE